MRDEQISLGARIIFIADALDAMLSDWPYRNALPMSHARDEIRRFAGTQFDPEIVEVFLSIPEMHWIEVREARPPPHSIWEYGVSPAIVPSNSPDRLTPGNAR